MKPQIQGEEQFPIPREASQSEEKSAKVGQVDETYRRIDVLQVFVNVGMIYHSERTNSQSRSSPEQALSQAC